MGWKKIATDRREAGPEKFGADGASGKAISATGCGRSGEPKAN
jgi:hypothetical protein